MRQHGLMAPGSRHLPTPDDHELTRRARAGDRQAFDRLADRHLERTFHLALRMVGNREDAEDVVQETFAKAHRHLPRFAGRSSFGTWLTSICIRLCLDVERRRRRRPRFSSLERLADGGAALPDPSSDGPDRRAQHRETLGRLEQHLQALPPRLRTALILRVLEGLDYPRVARSMGTTVRSARVYVSEARRLLSRRLQRGDPPEVGHA